jgi:hypothetical protein
MLQSANNLMAANAWTPLTNFTMASAVQSMNPGSFTNQMGFFRIVQQ